MYWDINKILPYQRNFNFINGERSIGKTYGTLKYIIRKCLENNLEFVYITRTQDEKKSGVLKEALAKVIQKEYSAIKFTFSNDEVSTPDGTLGYCLALSESVKIKKRSFPNVKYLVFDEYMLESGNTRNYVHGWSEPDLFLSIYHTIDREQDRVVCFLLGNNTSFYNPYHMHKAFNIPYVPKGQIWAGYNVLFQWATSDNELKSAKSNCKFLSMLEDTKYGEYAKEGNYIDDNVSFIEPISGSAKYSFTLEYDGFSFGVYNDVRKGRVYITDKVDPSCHIIYALTLSDHSENTLLTKTKTFPHLLWLSRNYKLGNVRFQNMFVKKKADGMIDMIL